MARPSAPAGWSSTWLLPAAPSLLALVLWVGVIAACGPTPPAARVDTRATPPPPVQAIVPVAPPQVLQQPSGTANRQDPALNTPVGGQQPGLNTERGLLVDVQSASIALLRSVELRTEDGRTMRFAVEGDTGLTPGHAREHMVGAEPVTVVYRATADGLVAVRIDD